jgi:hypothetical protein
LPAPNVSVVVEIVRRCLADEPSFDGTSDWRGASASGSKSKSNRVPADPDPDFDSDEHAASV